MTPKDFYLYRIFHGDMTLYIGKGSGKRLADQKRTFAVDGEIIAYFDFEDDAYREEKRLIELHAPPLNKHPGGCGGRVGIQAELPHGFTEEGLPVAAKYLARLVAMWKRDPKLEGVLKIVGAYVDAHGFDKVALHVVPHLKRLLVNNIAVENRL